jgi:hypothetical protein
MYIEVEDGVGLSWETVDLIRCHLQLGNLIFPLLLGGKKE